MTDTGLDLTVEELREGLTACLAVPRWVDDVVARAPYASLAELLDIARAAAGQLSEAEIDQALADHPRIGEGHRGAGRSAQFSSSEQSTSATGDAALAEALAAGNRAYEEKFDRVFLIRAAGRTRPEILAELNRRLELDAESELAEVASALRDIALLRIPQLFPTLDHHSGFDDAGAAR